MNAETITNTEMTWRREPFYGGCAYYAAEAPLTVKGFYDPDQFEEECSAWVADNVWASGLPPTRAVFPTAAQACATAESLWRYWRGQ